MLRIILFGLVVTVLMASCAAPLQLNNQYTANATTPATRAHGPNAGNEPERGIVQMAKVAESKTGTMQRLLAPGAASLLNAVSLPTIPLVSDSDESNKLQLKYGSLLNIVPAMLSNFNLLQAIDYWYGTRYVYGGTSKRGVDCSAFVRAVYKAAYGMELPRTAHEQYSATRRISSTELKEGDLVFFNTRGGVSHVGMYLRNNKFVHASSGKGVAISDLYEAYYMRRFIGAGRVE